MYKKLSVFMGFFLITTPAHADTTIALDTRFAESVLTDVCSFTNIDAENIRASETVIDMLAHFSQFRDYFTMEVYLEARQKAANCEESDRDIFRFNDVIEQKAALTSEILTLKQSQQDYSTDLTAMLAPYVPAGIAYSGRAVVAIGTPSCGGWSVGVDFYVDLPCIVGDQSGLKYLIAHESYHGVQGQFMPEPASDDSLERLFNAIVREGSATAIADFSTIKAGGSYTAKSKAVIRRNAARIQQNFDLLDMAIGYIMLSPKAETARTYDAVNNIGLSGSFDAPFYAVGATIFNAIDAVDGREVLVCLMQMPPSSLFARYRALTTQDDGLPKLGASTLSALGQSINTDYEQCLPDRN